MADENDKQNEEEWETKPVSPAPTLYYIHNTVRSRHNRTIRAQSPVHGGMRQHIGGTYRLVRGRPLAFTADQMGTHREELMTKERLGLIEVRLADGRRVDLQTGEPMPLGAVPPVNSTPNFPLDSAANDKPAGEAMPQFPGDVPITDEDPNKVPDLLKEAPSDVLEPPPPEPPVEGEEEMIEDPMAHLEEPPPEGEHGSHGRTKKKRR